MIIKLVGRMKDFDVDLCQDGGYPLKRERVTDVYCGISGYTHSYQKYEATNGKVGYTKTYLHFEINGTGYDIDTSLYDAAYVMNDDGKTIDRL